MPLTAVLACAPVRGPTTLVGKDYAVMKAIVLAEYGGPEVLILRSARPSARPQARVRNTRP